MFGKAWLDHPRVQVALEDFKEQIRARYPDATFEVTHGGEPDGVHLLVFVDLEDTVEVLDAIMDRLLEVQIDEYLPVYVLPLRPDGSKFETPPRRRQPATSAASSV